MQECLFVVKSFTYEKGSRECSCHQTIRFEKGDRLHIVQNPYAVANRGWYVLVRRNEEGAFPMSARFVQDLYDKRAVYTKMDVQLALNYYTYKINQALESKDEQSFRIHAGLHARFSGYLEDRLVKGV
ncbi:MULTISPECIES: hypothetical protein [Halobacillus]|uniref:hypothetical protein n=1 Tax=Halobacillus TaxID=45667 RepID=UPI00136BA61D|nr:MULTISPECIES: hypothetical protein [Halobacillus]MYL30101.1 hypothetical protein [Halobacillus halophilus]MYL37434.1 hypothetical protein [Halobacillus litoralis]